MKRKERERKKIPKINLWKKITRTLSTPSNFSLTLSLTKKKKEKFQRSTLERCSKPARRHRCRSTLSFLPNCIYVSASHPRGRARKREEGGREKEREREGKARKREPAGTSSQYCITIPPHSHPFPFLSAATLRLSSPPSVLAESLSKVRGYARWRERSSKMRSKVGSLAYTERKGGRGGRKKEGRRFARPFFRLPLPLRHPLSTIRFPLSLSLSILFLFFFFEGNKRGRK